MPKLEFKPSDISLRDCLVIFDFDNTITEFDTLDDIVERFAINKDWVGVEKMWKQGKIGSRKCLELQLGLVRITRQNLIRYLSSVKLDPYFKKLVRLLNSRKIKFIILSDNFSFIINKVLKDKGLRGIKVYSNSLKFKGDRLLLKFPHQNRSCLRCGHCKKSNLLKNSFRDKIIYIGDGLSDVCPARHSDIVFAKGSLLKHLRKINKDCIPIRNLKDAYQYFIKLK